MTGTDAREDQIHSSARESLGSPFLRWAGGKSRIVRHLLTCVPKRFAGYWEPFLGAGALFFALQPDQAHLSDSNSALISCFRDVLDRPNLLHRYLRSHLAHTSEDHYYRVRDTYNHTARTSVAQSARFLYLNRAGFNGIYRVNKEGEYNVPYGHKEPPPAPSRQALREASTALQQATLCDDSYERVLSNSSIRETDFVYLDPPYPPMSLTSKFNHYTASRFTWKDQVEVARYANVLRARGCFVMISNAGIQEIRDLYDDWYIHHLPVTRWVSANGSRHQVVELVITSYQVI